MCALCRVLPPAACRTVSLACRGAEHAVHPMLTANRVTTTTTSNNYYHHPGNKGNRAFRLTTLLTSIKRLPALLTHLYPRGSHCSGSESKEPNESRPTAVSKQKAATDGWDDREFGTRDMYAEWTGGLVSVGYLCHGGGGGGP